MGTVTFSDVSGEGIATIGSDWIPVLELDAHLTTPGPKTRIIGSDWPRAVRYAGHVGLAAVSGIFPGDPFPNVAGPEYTIANEDQAWYIVGSQGGFTYWTSVYWRLAPGVVIDVVLWW